MYLLNIIMSTPFKKKIIEAIRLITKIFLGADSNRVENTALKKFYEVVWLFRTFSEVYILKIIMSIPFEKIH